MLHIDLTLKELPSRHTCPSAIVLFLCDVIGKHLEGVFILSAPFFSLLPTPILYGIHSSQAFIPESPFISASPVTSLMTNPVAILSVHRSWPFSTFDTVDHSLLLKRISSLAFWGATHSLTSPTSLATSQSLLLDPPLPDLYMLECLWAQSLDFVLSLCDFIFFKKASLLLFFFLNLFIYFWLHWGCVGSSLLHVGFLWLRWAGATLPRGARASHCRVFSRCGARALGVWTLVVVARGL